MAEHRPTPRRAATLGAAGALIALCAGCSSGVPEPTLPPAPPPVPPPEAAPPAPPAPTTVVIDPGGGPQEPTLLEASRRAKEEKAKAPPPVAVITNENLGEYAAKGKLTQAQPAPRPAEGEEETAAVELRGEEYWRNAVFQLRLQWRQAVDEVAELEEAAAGLRQRFYGEDDTYLRDSQIKPRWDRVLDRLEEARRDAERYQEELAAMLEAGRRAGALPGWLREGIELEPEPPEPPEELPEHEMQEPEIVGEGRP